MAATFLTARAGAIQNPAYRPAGIFFDGGFSCLRNDLPRKTAVSIQPSETMNHAAGS